MPHHPPPVAPPPAAPARRLANWGPQAPVLLAVAVLLALLVAVSVRQERLRQHERAAASAQNLARLLEAQVAGALNQADLLLQAAAAQVRDTTDAAPPAPPAASAAAAPAAPAAASSAPSAAASPPAAPPATTTAAPPAVPSAALPAPAAASAPGAAALPGPAGSGPATAAALRALAAASPALRDLRVADRQGHWRLRLGGDAAPAGSAGEREEFQRARADPQAGLIVTGPLHHGEGTPWVLVLSRALSDAEGRFDGLVSVDLPVTRFDALFAAIDLGDDGIAALRTEALALVYQRPWPREGLAAVGSANDSPDLGEAIAANPLAGDYEAAPAPDGVARFHAYRKVADAPLVLLLGLARDGFAHGWTARDTAILGLALATLGTAGAALRSLQREHRRALGAAGEAMAEQRRELAWHDEPTGLPARRLLLDRLQRAQLVSRRLGSHGALLRLDVDPAGAAGRSAAADADPRAAAVARRLRAAVRETDTVARLGRSAYALVCENLGADPVEAAARVSALQAKIAQAVASAVPLPAAGGGAPAIGCRLFNGNGDAPDRLIAEAEAAMALHPAPHPTAPTPAPGQDGAAVSASDGAAEAPGG